MRLMTALLLLPIVEIALFIRIGGLIGLLPTLALVIASAWLGLAVMRRQGLAALADVQRSVEQLRDPSAPLAEGALMLLAGGLLVLPGFLTDALGLALLIPTVRRRVRARFGRRVTKRVHGAAWPRPASPVIEAEYVVLDESPARPGRPPSGWTRH